jgi:hypothetical protein
VTRFALEMRGQTGLCLIGRKTTGLALGSAPSRSSLTRADIWQDNPSEQLR